MTDDWPYADLRLCTPHCPWCGEPAQIMAGANVHPQAWCINDDCPALTWDPSVPAKRLIDESRQMVEETTPEGGTLVRPETDEERTERLSRRV